MDYSVKVEGLTELKAAIAKAGGDAGPLIHKAATTAGLEIQKLARLKAPHRTGTLQRSIQMESRLGHVAVKVNEKYGIYIEEGTGPFTITPRNKQALFWPGADHPVRSVRHPGIKARPFFRPAIEEATPFVLRQFKAVHETLVRNIAAKGRV